MTRAQFIAASARAHKKISRIFVAWSVWFFVGMAVVFLLRVPAEIRDDPVFNDHRSGIPFAMHLVFSLLLLCWGMSAVSRRTALFCPACAKPVTGSQIVIACGNCGHCGSPVLDVLPAPAQGGPA